MKILLVNKFYRPNGGAETVFLATKQLLEKEGHEVVPFAMSHEDNLSSEWSTYFTRRRSYTEGRLPARARDALSAVYSMDARRSLRVCSDASRRTSHTSTTSTTSSASPSSGSSGERAFRWS